MKRASTLRHVGAQDRAWGLWARPDRQWITVTQWIEYAEQQLMGENGEQF